MIHVIWYKRDLRLSDHEPLSAAAKSGESVLPIYIVEPSIWKQDHLSVRHFQFVKEGLNELAKGLHELGAPLYTAIAEIEDTLSAIYEQAGPFTLHVHKEHGTPVVAERNSRVRRWMADKGLEIKEYAYFGIKMGNREDEFINHLAQTSIPLAERPKQLTPVPAHNVPEALASSLQILESFRSKGVQIKRGQTGGERQAQETLNSFLATRFQDYTAHISTPLPTEYSGSRLSPYLAWGNISLRTVVQKIKQTIESSSNSAHQKQLHSFLSRLQWRSKYIQKLGESPIIAEQSIDPSYDRLRKPWNEEIFQYWLHGQTGIPTIDASMRELWNTGWINYRSRAMVLSFICNTMMLEWQKPAAALAELLLDYEPGIHYNQVQIQSGTSGQHSLRVYNAIQQGKDHDPEGKFIKQHVSELLTVPSNFIHEPWLYPGFDSLGYPEPIAQITSANKEARMLFRRMRSSIKRQNIIDHYNNSIKLRSSRLREDLFGETET